MKIIKFDLPIDGVTIKTVEELREHFTVEILALYNNGILLKWLRARKNLEEVSRLEAIPATLSQFSLLKTLCEIFTVDADDMIISAALGMQPEKMEKNFPEIKLQYQIIAREEVKSELATNKEYKISSGKYLIYKNGTVIDISTQLMWKQTTEGRYSWHVAIEKFGKNVHFADYNDWRMPTKEELQTLPVYDSNSLGKSKIDSIAFPNVPNEFYWSSSNFSDCADSIYINYGDHSFDSKRDKNHILLVRNAKQAFPLIIHISA